VRRKHARKHRGCDHCGATRRLRPSRTDPTNMLCGKCWNRFGGKNRGGPVANRAAGRRRSQAQ
jgi:hypothetical protein